MNLSAKIDQQRATLLSLFYMFVAMVLVVIRAGLDARLAYAPLLLIPHDDTPSRENAEPHDDGWELDDGSAEDVALALHLQSTSAPPPEFYQAALALLCAAQAIARMLESLVYTYFELLNQARKIARSFDQKAKCLPGQRAEARLDAP